MKTKNTTAGKVGDAGPKYIGKTVTFPDFHGRTITGPLDAADAPRTAMYASLTVNGRTHGVFRNTLVTVTLPMDVATADDINRRDARLIAEFLDALDTRLSGDRKPWYFGPMGAAFLDDHDDDSCNSYRAWLIGKHAWRIPDLTFDGAPARSDWDNFFQHMRDAIVARRNEGPASETRKSYTVGRVRSNPPE